MEDNVAMGEMEVERKFAVADGVELPSLDGVVTVGVVREHRLRAVYLDTRDFLLVRRGIVLRRREGGTDEGWHLKLPVRQDARLEVTAPLGRGRAPWVPGKLLRALEDALGTPLEGVAGALLPVAVLETRRRETELLEHDRVVAMLADDDVAAEPGGRWREVEVELTADQPRTEVLDRVTDALATEGIAPSRAESKLARALGDRPERGPGRSATAAEVVLDYLADQVAVIVGRRQELREGASDSVHKTRVATRRIRTTLRVFRRLFRREVTDPLRDELRWLATALGEPRDAEVMGKRILAALDGLDDSVVVGDVRSRLPAAIDERRTTGQARLVEVLDSRRYADLLDALLELLVEPPWRGRARRRARTVLPPLVREAYERVEREWVAAGDADGEEAIHRLHETRKKAKAVRHACELLVPIGGDEAEDAAEAWEEVTERFGDLQDASVAVEWLRELEPRFTGGVLVGLELAGRDALREQLPDPTGKPRRRLKRLAKSLR